MILDVPSVDAFVDEVRRAGVEVVYTVYKTETRDAGLKIYRMRFVATALGVVVPYRYGDGKQRYQQTLIRLEHDFGPVYQDLQTGGVPEFYLSRVGEDGEIIRNRLLAEGFDVRVGEISLPARRS
jgi:hypothetical protein